MQTGFITCYKVTIQAVRLKNFVLGLHIIVSISNIVKIYFDNASLIFYSKNNKRFSSSKHNEIKYLMLKINLKRDRQLLNMWM